MLILVVACQYADVRSILYLKGAHKMPNFSVESITGAFILKQQLLVIYVCYIVVVICFIPLNKRECLRVFFNLFLNILILVLVVVSPATAGYCLGSLIHIRYHI